MAAALKALRFYLLIYLFFYSLEIINQPVSFFGRVAILRFRKSISVKRSPARAHPRVERPGIRVQRFRQLINKKSFFCFTRFRKIVNLD